MPENLTMWLELSLRQVKAADFWDMEEKDAWRFEFNHMGNHSVNDSPINVIKPKRNWTTTAWVLLPGWQYTIMCKDGDLFWLGREREPVAFASGTPSQILSYVFLLLAGFYLYPFFVIIKL